MSTVSRYPYPNSQHLGEGACKSWISVRVELSVRIFCTTIAPAAASTGACCPPPEARQSTIFTVKVSTP
ncbi:MAG TPA: hypothetical protein EYP91_15900 [Gammaproteobacteria bacterium]|nr:hypothetical protein [Gammaproteobacteria bacterium]